MVNARINWMGTERPPNQASAEEQILRELGEITEDTELDKLVFHTVFLGDTMEDASVCVSPSDDDPTSVDCWYSEKTAWVPLSSMDDGDEEAINRLRSEMQEGPLPDSQPLVDGDEI